MNKELQNIAEELMKNFRLIKSAKDNKVSKGEDSYKEIKIRTVEKFCKDITVLVIKENNLPLYLKEKVDEDVSTVNNVENIVNCDLAVYDIHSKMKYLLEVKDYIDTTMYKRFAFDVACAINKYPDVIGIGLCLQPAMTDVIKSGWDLQNEKLLKGLTVKSVYHFSLVDKQRVSKNIIYLLDYSQQDINNRVQLLYNNLSKVLK